MGDLVAEPRDEVYGDPGVHALSVTFFENLKSSQQRHQVCMEMLTSRSPLDDRVKFICLEFIDHYVRDSYEGATAEARVQMRTFLLRYGQVQLVTRRLEELRVRNMAASIFARVCLIDYPARWPDFFTSLSSMAANGEKGGDHMLHTLRHLHRLITGRSTPGQDLDRLYGAVQRLQKRDFGRVLNAVAGILDTPEKASVTLQKEAMATVGAWVTLIDPGVFTRHRTLGLTLRKLENRGTQKPALTFLIDLTKVLDVSVANQASFVGLVFQQLVALGLTEPSEATEKLSARVGNLLVEIGCRMLDILIERDKDSSHPENENITDLNQCFAVCEEFLKSKTISISASVIPFFIQYVGLLKKRKKASLTEYSNCIRLLEIVLANMKLRVTQYFKDEVKNQPFTNYRKTLVKLFEEIAALKRKAVYKGVYNVIFQQLVNKDWIKSPFPQAEYPIFLLNLLCFTYRTASVKSLRVLMRALMNSDLSLQPHPAVAIQYFQAFAKNVGFFKSEGKFIPVVVAMFQDGLRDDNERVRTIAAEQLLRFVLGVGTLSTDTYADILRVVHDVAFTRGTFKEVPRFTELGGRSLFNLLEVAGVSAVRGRFTRQRKRHLVAETIVPAMHLYHDASHSWSTTGNRDATAETICQAIDVVASLARAFDATTAVTSGCDDVFVDTLSILDHLEQAQLTRSNIHASFTQLVFQMVYILEDRFLPFLPRMLKGILSCKKGDNVIEAAKLLIFVVDKYKSKILKFMRQDFIRCSQYIYESLTISSKHVDYSKKVESRQRLFLSFVTSLLEYGLLTEILLILDEKAVAKTVSMVVQSTVEGPRGEGRIRGLVVVNRLLDKWPRPGERHGEPSFLCAVAQYLVMGAFLAMRDAAGHQAESQADYTDTFAQCVQLVKKARRRCEADFVTWLKHDYLSQLGVGQQLIDQLIEALTGENNVQIEDLLKHFFSESPDTEIPPLPPSIPIRMPITQQTSL